MHCRIANELICVLCFQTIRANIARKEKCYCDPFIQVYILLQQESMLRATANIIAKLCVSKRMGYADHSYDHFFDNVTRL